MAELEDSPGPRRCLRTDHSGVAAADLARDGTLCRRQLHLGMLATEKVNYRLLRVPHYPTERPTPDVRESPGIDTS